MRSKVTNYLTQQLQDVAKGEKQIREELKDDPKLEEELRKYFDETVVVSGDNFVKPLNVIKEKVKELTSEECEREFSGNDAYALSVLYDAFELGGEE
jgi:siroheme synthase (precorrin-2 oxidase/ferrochelatase)